MIIAEMKIEITKSQHNSVHKRKTNSSYACYKAKLPVEVCKYLGSSISIVKTNDGYELRRFGEVQEGRAIPIGEYGNLTFPKNMVKEFEDQGDYTVEIDEEAECVYLTKIKHHV